MAYSGWSCQTHILQQGLNTIDFSGTKPNVFMLTNLSDCELYIGMFFLPNENVYEFKNSKGSISFGRPIKTDRVYIYKPTMDDSKIILYSMYSPVFEPSFLQSFNIDLSDDVVDKIKGDGIIKGFTTQLPSGSNQIGSVNVDKLPPLSKGDNLIGKIDINNISDMFNINKDLGNVSLVKNQFDHLLGAFPNNKNKLIYKLVTIPKDQLLVSIDLSTIIPKKLTISNDCGVDIHITGNDTISDIIIGDVYKDESLDINLPYDINNLSLSIRNKPDIDVTCRCWIEGVLR